MRKVLIVDDDTEIFLDYLFEELKSRGFAPRGASSLREAIDILEKESDFCVVILDIILPLRPEEDKIFEDYFGRKPTGPTDAMRAGLSLLPTIRQKKIPVVILTNLDTLTKIGEEIARQIPSDINIFHKPPKEEFYEEIEKLSRNCR